MRWVAPSGLSVSTWTKQKVRNRSLSFTTVSRTFQRTVGRESMIFPASISKSSSPSPARRVRKNSLRTKTSCLKGGFCWNSTASRRPRRIVLPLERRTNPDHSHGSLVEQKHTSPTRKRGRTSADVVHLADFQTRVNRDPSLACASGWYE